MTKIFGERHILDHLINNKIGMIIDDFLNGRINFDNENRIRNSMDRLILSEQHTKIIISDAINEFLYEKPLFLTHNHPTPFLFDIFAHRIFQTIGEKYKPLSACSVIPPFLAGAKSRG